MNRIDKNAAPNAPTAGIHLAQVFRAELSTSKSGFPMLVIDLIRVSDGAALCRDWIMLAGRGWDAFGKAKLQALGVSQRFEGDLEGWNLVGRRVRVHLVANVSSQGRVYLNVDTNRGALKGYDLPTAADVILSDSDAPF